MLSSSSSVSRSSSSQPLYPLIAHLFNRPAPPSLAESLSSWANGPWSCLSPTMGIGTVSRCYDLLIRSRSHCITDHAGSRVYLESQLHAFHYASGGHAHTIRSLVGPYKPRRTPSFTLPTSIPPLLQKLTRGIHLVMSSSSQVHIFQDCSPKSQSRSSSVIISHIISPERSLLHHDPPVKMLSMLP